MDCGAAVDYERERTMAIYLVTFDKATWDISYPQSLNRDAKEWHWARLNVSFFHNQEFAVIEPNERLAYLEMLAQSAISKRHDRVPVDSARICASCKVTEERFRWLLDWFISKGLLTSVDQHVDERPKPTRNKNAAKAQRTRNKNAAKAQQGCNEISAPYDTSTGQAQNSQNNPLTPTTTSQPSQAGPPKQFSRKQIDQHVVTTLAKAVAARLRGASEEEALKELGKGGMRLLCLRFNTWDQFCACYKREWDNGYEERFLANTETQLKALAHEALENYNRHSAAKTAAVSAADANRALRLIKSEEASYSSEGHPWPN